jgi:hypothetical protein
MRVFWLLGAEILLALAGAFAYYYWPRHLPLPKSQIWEKVACTDEHSVIFWPERCLVGKLAECEDATFAYLLFDYLRAQKRLECKQVMLTVDRRPNGWRYRILVRLPDDLLSGVRELAQLKAQHLTSRVEYAWIRPSELSQDRQDTMLFLSAYSDPNFGSLQQIPSAELQFYVRQFIRFKSATDPRTWKQTPFALSPVSVEEADRLAADIIAVAEFYGVPIDVFLGIGAMENNFLSAPGDLNNAIWKRRAEPDDIVLQQKGHKVWILNSSIGIWQITRQSLRHAQQLFLADQRDYSRLPQRLRPTQKLDLENLHPDVLTTYAGLLLRDLLDHFAGDMVRATGAYNGTIRHPNLRYAAGVEMVARYARTVMGNAAELSSLAASQPSAFTRESETAEVHSEAAVHRPR